MRSDAAAAAERDFPVFSSKLLHRPTSKDCDVLLRPNMTRLAVFKIMTQSSFG
jgi:hypothetical protein